MKASKQIEIVTILLSFLAGSFLIFCIIAFCQHFYLTAIMNIIFCIGSILTIPLYKWTYKKENGTPRNQK